MVLEHYIIQHRLRVGTNVIICQKLSLVVYKNTMECNGRKYHIKLYREEGRLAGRNLIVAGGEDGKISFWDIY